ncbi:hypothetical protein AVEN_31324-1 [Araneus ventricosus]|uniref:Histone-lysine N-methyltransferase SETMAR n=1 Tax=Araneus ventricosus TaxID=182803 RepID=A0A4Y2S7U5_ARAVE|nr:hypothetical protein AVEN_31324-1 [Araneus ventricosus]
MHVPILLVSLKTLLNISVGSSSPYNPDLAPPDYHLFLNLKRDFGGRRFDNVRNGVQQWLSPLVASFLEEGIDKLVSRYDKCLHNSGNYVET